MIKIKELLMNFENEVIGIENIPTFSWILESDKKNITQKSYQLNIASDNLFDNIIFDTSMISSDISNSVNIDYSVNPSSKYYVRVKVIDNTNEESPWSNTVTFITTFDKKWQGDFISGNEKADEDYCMYVRGKFSTKKDIKEAYVYSTALGIYDMYINGERIGNDLLKPGWTSYNNRILFQTYDITKLIKDENIIGAELGSGWYKGAMSFELRRNIYGDNTAFLCQILVKYQDGSEEVFSTNQSWQSKKSPRLFSDIYNGELYDANKEIKDWSSKWTDDWNSVIVVDYDKNKLIPQSYCKIKFHEILIPDEITTPKGEKVLDFQQNMTGWVEFTVNGNKDDIVELKCFESLDADGNVYLDNLRSAKQTIKYILKGDAPETFEPRFTFQGFQYVQIVSAPKDIKVKGKVIHSDMKEVGNITTSNEKINRLFQNIKWGLKGNFLDIPTDCPQRDERLGWTGDAQIFIRTAGYIMNVNNFFSKWMKDVALEQSKEKGVPFVVPNILTPSTIDDNFSDDAHSSTAWADVAVIAPWTAYIMYGDQKILEEQYSSMKDWVDFMYDHSHDYIWSYKLQFGDWVALDVQEELNSFGATPADLICTAYFAYSTNLLAKTAKILGNEADYEKYSELEQKIRVKYNNKFIKKNGDLVYNTQTAYIVTLYFDLAPEQFRNNLLNSLLNLIKDNGNNLDTGFVGTPYACLTLSKLDRDDKAYDLLFNESYPSWLFQVNMGATTVWEHWDGKRPDGSMWDPMMNSFNHYAYGAIGEWMFRVMCGIELNENKPGFKEIIISPKFDKRFDFVEGTHYSVYGEIKVRWEIDNNKVHVKVTIPVNTTAKVILGDKVTEIGSGTEEFTVNL